VRQMTGFRRAHVPLMLLLPLLTYWMWICITFYSGRMVIPTSWEQLRELASHVPVLATLFVRGSDPGIRRVRCLG